MPPITDRAVPRIDAVVRNKVRDFRDAWNASSATKDRTEPKARAVALVNAHPEAFTDFSGLTLSECVKEIDKLRARGDSAGVDRGEAYVLAMFPPQRIIGRFRGS